MEKQNIPIEEILFWGAGLFGVLVFRFLSWFMPQTAALWFDKIRKTLTKDLAGEVRTLTQKVDILIIENAVYKKQKHSMEGELAYCKDAIQSEDAEKLKLLKEIYDEKDL